MNDIIVMEVLLLMSYVINMYVDTMLEEKLVFKLFSLKL